VSGTNPSGYSGYDLNVIGGPADLSLWGQLYGTTQAGQRLANLGRIPGAAGLEQQSSDVISRLLNPPELYAETSRLGGEYGAIRGVAGSPSAFQTGLRLTRNEQLRDLALGQQMLSAAYERNPAAALPDILQTVITPEEQAEIDARNRAIAAQEEQNQLAREKWNWERNRLEQPSITYSGSPSAGTSTRGTPLGARSSRGGELDSLDYGSLARYGTTDPDAFAAAVAGYYPTYTPGVISGSPVQPNPLARTSSGEPFPTVPWDEMEANLGMPGYPDYIPGQYGYTAPDVSIPSGTGLIIGPGGEATFYDYGNQGGTEAPPMTEGDWDWLYGW
jgi:hypothetical protein